MARHRSVEFFVGQKVRFAPGAYVSSRLIDLPARVEGYDEGMGEHGEIVDYVIVLVDGVEQWVLPRELVPQEGK